MEGFRRAEESRREGHAPLDWENEFTDSEEEIVERRPKMKVEVNEAEMEAARKAAKRGAKMRYDAGAADVDVYEGVRVKREEGKDGEEERAERERLLTGSGVGTEERKKLAKILEIDDAGSERGKKVVGLEIWRATEQVGENMDVDGDGAQLPQ